MNNSAQKWYSISSLNLPSQLAVISMLSQTTGRLKNCARSTFADMISLRSPPAIRQRQMGAFSYSDFRPSQHFPGYGGAGAVRFVSQSLHGFSSISHGRHSFGGGFDGVGGVGGGLGVGGENIGNGKHDGKDHAAKGCGMAAMRAMARNKTRWHLIGAIDLDLVLRLRSVYGTETYGW
jgi:hypothetical protein